ncbi:MT-A70 family methyltransferase [Novosphingobium sp. 9]|uniref:MT-A70 family methyltransferase n=1 Tax=Novosphingobium sp. 9 TaxID=2025349 RepID=UPI0021B56D25|nr:MT-A70 family methyltransferase [Novosphingobium sp. 9]
MTWPFGEMRPMSYGALLVDPPWQFRNYSAKGEAKNPVSHYACMSLADIAALPVAHLAAPDCALFMWATAPMLPEAIELLKAWGFTYKSGAAWAKQSSTGARWAFGTGYVFRSAAEFLLVGTIGKPRIRSRRQRNLIVAPIREHSRKPDDQYAMVEALYAGPYAEIFSRSNRPRWDCWGNEAGKFERGIA